MSWARKNDPHGVYSAQAAQLSARRAPTPWHVEVWEVTEQHAKGQRFHAANAQFLQKPAKLRLVFAPSARPNRDDLPQTLELFKFLNIPDDFIIEQTQFVSHSFAHRSDQHGWCSWFYFLCKNINTKRRPDGGVEIYTRAKTNLPGADYTWNHATFFLRSDNSGGVTLVCFGGIYKVKSRLEEFIAAGAWADVIAQPYALFDLVLEALQFEVDNTIWKMNGVFSTHERDKLQLSNDLGNSKARNDLSNPQRGSKDSFTSLHNCAKHMVYLSEALESCLMVLDAIVEAVKTKNREEKTRFVDLQLQECLQYRRTLFRSSQLRLGSLQRRTDNAITLSFNLVTQQGSMLMMQDSNTMRMIAAITMVFLPTTAVATVVGSQLLVATQEKGTWDVAVTPLFWLTWWIAIPLTMCVLAVALTWHWWTRRGRPWKDFLESTRDLNRRIRWTKGRKNEDDESKT